MNDGLAGALAKYPRHKVMIGLALALAVFSADHSALNIGNALGAFLGGMVIASGWGFVAPAWVGVILALGGLGIALASIALERSRVPVAA